jgi:hypothetical protein
VQVTVTKLAKPLSLLQNGASAQYGRSAALARDLFDKNVAHANTSESDACFQHHVCQATRLARALLSDATTGQMDSTAVPAVRDAALCQASEALRTLKQIIEASEGLPSESLRTLQQIIEADAGLLSEEQ